MDVLVPHPNSKCCLLVTSKQSIYTRAHRLGDAGPRPQSEFWVPWLHISRSSWDHVTSPGFHSGSQYAALPSPPVLCLIRWRCYPKPRSRCCPGSSSSSRVALNPRSSADPRLQRAYIHSSLLPDSKRRHQTKGRWQCKVPADHLGLTHLNGLLAYLSFIHSTLTSLPGPRPTLETSLGKYE